MADKHTTEWQPNHPLLRIWRTLLKGLKYIISAIAGAHITRLWESLFVTATVPQKIVIVSVVIVGTTVLAKSIIDERQPTIAFTSNMTGNFDIHIMNANGENVQRITSSQYADIQPNWSTDGSKIAFASDRTGNRDIFIYDTNLRNEINLTNNLCIDAFPQISPDGTQVVFSSNRDTNGDNQCDDNDIYIVNLDGSGLRPLTSNDLDDYWPTWSQDGMRILYTSGFVTQTDQSRDICIIDIDGLNQRCLTSDEADEIDPIMSPNGDKIAFVSKRSGFYELYVMDFDGWNATNPRRVFGRNPGTTLHPDWSHDGSQIVVMVSTDSDIDFGNTAQWSNKFEVYIVNVADNSYRAITNNTFDDAEPDWRP